MMKKGSRTLMRAAWFVALTLCVLVPLSSRAELLEAELEVNGMACPFCAFGIEKKLRASARGGVVVVNGTPHGEVDGLPGLLVIGTEPSAGGPR